MPAAQSRGCAVRVKTRVSRIHNVQRAKRSYCKVSSIKWVSLVPMWLYGETVFDEYLASAILLS